jgi:predicted flavoprotein YhiN
MCFCFVNIISSFQNSILIGWFPSKSIKVWRKKDGVLFHQSWSKFLIKVFFDKENFDSDSGP